MTLHDLIMNDLITDVDKIRVVKPLQANIVDMRKGFWFNDQILDLHNDEVTEFLWSKEKGWTVTLEGTE